MGIDWENILGTEHDLQDAYDNNIPDNRSTHSNDFGPDDFDVKRWYREAMNSELETSEYAGLDGESVPGNCLVDKYVTYLTNKENDISDDLLIRAIIFVLTDGFGIYLASKAQTGTVGFGDIELGMNDPNFGIEARLEGKTIESKSIKSGTDKEFADLFSHAYNVRKGQMYPVKNDADALANVFSLLLHWYDDDDVIELCDIIEYGIELENVDWDYLRSKINA